MYSGGVALRALALVSLTASTGAYFLLVLRDLRVASKGPLWWYTPGTGPVMSRVSMVSLGCWRRWLCRCGARSAARCCLVSMASGRCDMSPGYRSLSEPARRGMVSFPAASLVSEGWWELARRRCPWWSPTAAMMPALGLGVDTLLARARMVPWFQRVCGGLAVWMERLRSKLDSGGYLERGGEGGRGLRFTLLLRRNGTASSGFLATGFRCLWPRYSRIFLVDDGCVERGSRRVALTWFGSGS